MPVCYPILNDKILLKVWSQNKRTQDVLIANIPERPTGTDPFNLQKLMAQEGKMKIKWFNLYGTLPEDRNGWFGGSTCQAYLG